MKINTNNNITVQIPRLSNLSHENRGSEWHYRWLSWLILCLCLVVTTNAQAFRFPTISPHPDNVGHCGGHGQRVCNVWEAVPSCNSGLAQDFIKGTCGTDVVGQWLEQAFIDAGGTILKTGQVVVQFTEEQAKQAVETAKKGLKEAEKGVVGIATTAYKEAGKGYVNQIKNPLTTMVDVFVQHHNSQQQDFVELENAINSGNGAEINSALDKILVAISKRHIFSDAVDHFKKSGAGSFLIFVKGGGGIVLSADASLGLAIDIDYMVYLAKGSQGIYKGPVVSLFTAVGVDVGGTVGLGGDMFFGYHTANPNGVNGPSFDLSLEMKVGVGGSLGVGFDMTKAPWQLNTAAIGIGPGAKLQFSAGASYGVIMGQLCGNGKFVALARNCPSMNDGKVSDTGTEYVSKFAIIAKHSNKALETPDFSTKNTARIRQWSISGSAHIGQQWIIEQVEGNNFFYIRNVFNGLYMSILHTGIGNGSVVAQVMYMGDDAQQWSIEEVGDDYYRISTKVNPSLVLDVTGPSQADGANIQLWSYMNVSNQLFKLDKIENNPAPGTYYIEGVQSGKVVEAGGSTSNQANIKQWTKNGTTTQQWTLELAKDGIHYYIKNVKSGLYMDSRNGENAKDASDVYQHTYHGANNQQWSIDRLKSGSYLIRSAARPHLVLDVEGPSVEDGADIQLWSIKDLDNQKFRLNTVLISLGSVASYTNLGVNPDGSVYASRNLKSWEKFTLINNNDGTISFKSHHSTYLAVNLEGLVYATPNLDSWEKFTQVNNNDGTISFRSHHSTFLSVQSDGLVKAISMPATETRFSITTY